ncbi:FHA domain-containing protein [bacterium]|nr:FHA domain-containing protein [bacterium]
MKLTLTLSGRTLERFELDKDSVKIGRNEDCDVTIDNLGVSRYHAEILQKDGFYVLRDLKSNNGTFVNGRRVDNYNLNDGDEISIGKFTISFSGKAQVVLPEPAAPEGDDLAKTADTGDPDKAPAPGEGGKEDFGGMTMQMDQRALAQLQREKSSRVRGYLIADDGGGKKTNVFLEKSVFVIGKGEDSDIKLTGWRTPRKVAVIFRDESGFRLIDVTSSGGAIVVNGKKVDDVRLGDNDELKVWGKAMKFMRGTPVR